MDVAVSQVLPDVQPKMPVQDPGKGLVTSRELLGDANTLFIEHQGMVYTLRLTRNGKLILTK